MATDLTWTKVPKESPPETPEKFYDIAHYGINRQQGAVTVWTRVGILLDTTVTPHQFWRVLTTGYGEMAEVEWHRAKYPV